MRYFPHAVTVGFFGLALAFRSSSLGACAVTVMALITAKEVYESYFVTKKQTELEVLLKVAMEENGKMREEMAKLSSSVGAMNYKVNQITHYVGAPEN